MMVSFIKKAYRKLIPIIIKNGISNFRLKREVELIKKQQIVLISELKEKSIINVIFLAFHDSVWKYEKVCGLLKEDNKFDVKVVIIPLVRNGKADMETYKHSLLFFQQNNYNTISSYDYENKQWIDINALLKPDIVFFTNPHKLTFNKYYIQYFKNSITIYVSYAFIVIHDLKLHYNHFHDLLWKYFVETKYHYSFARTLLNRNNENVVITGYPGLDSIFDSSYKPKEVWKLTNNKTKKIVWAPHHSIPDQGSILEYSSFFELSKFLVKLLNKRSDIQIAFKPHPFLKENLYAHINWGKEKTDDYYNSWDKLSNGQLETGAYIDLFYTSDAMIMDSASFIAEYLFFDKPLCFTMVDDEVKNRFNSFGQKVFDYLYTAKDEIEIELFIDETVIGNNDYLKIERNNFLKNTILPKNGRTASQNIYEELIKELC